MLWRSKPGAVFFERKMPNDALTQFLGRIAELKRSLVTSDRPTGHRKTETAMQAIRRDIAEYERAIIALIPKAGCLGAHAH
jgi:hypothetical protein